MQGRSDWVRMRSHRGGECSNCGVKFGAGSDIEWYPATKSVRCGPCADGKDIAWEKLKPEQRAFLEQQMFEASRLSNLIPPAKERHAERLRGILGFLREFNHLNVVARFLKRFGLE